MSFSAFQKYSNIFSVYHGIFPHKIQIQTVFIIIHGSKALVTHSCDQVSAHMLAFHSLTEREKL